MEREEERGGKEEKIEDMERDSREREKVREREREGEGG